MVFCFFGSAHLFPRRLVKKGPIGADSIRFSSAQDLDLSALLKGNENEMKLIFEVHLVYTTIDRWCFCGASRAPEITRTREQSTFYHLGTQGRPSRCYSRPTAWSNETGLTGVPCFPQNIHQSSYRVEYGARYVHR